MQSKIIKNCPFCGKNFLNNRSFSKHIQICSKENKKFKDVLVCCFCEKNYKNKNFYVRHIKEHIENPTTEKKIKIKCDFCEKSFKNEKNLKNHSTKCSIKKRYENVSRKGENNSGYKLYCKVVSYKMKNKKDVDVKSYIRKNNYYNFFEDLNEWLIENFLYMEHLENREKYVEFCLKNKISYKNWKKKTLVDKFIKEQWISGNLKSEIYFFVNFVKKYMEKSNIEKENNLLEQYFSLPYHVILQHLIAKAYNPVFIFVHDYGDKFYKSLPDYAKEEFKKILSENFEKIKLKGKMNKSTISKELNSLFELNNMRNINFKRKNFSNERNISNI